MVAWRAGILAHPSPDQMQKSGHAGEVIIFLHVEFVGVLVHKRMLRAGNRKILFFDGKRRVPQTVTKLDSIQTTMPLG